MTRRGIAFTPKATRSFEETVRALALPHFPAPFEGPVRVTVHAVFELPKSWSKKKKHMMLERPHTQRPDLDNLIKSITDGLNRIAYDDDGQIAEVFGRKLWGERAYTLVAVDLWDRDDT
jgi:Holliday junction resolvase RusA-like endonuclease